MGDNDGVRALLRRKTVRIGAVLLVLSLAIALTVVARNAMRYRQAVALNEAGDAQGAYEIFHALGRYSDAAQRAQALVDADPALPYRRASKGDTIEFGSYEQDGDTSNGAEPIRWIVLDEIDGQLLLLSADVLEARQYHHVPFEDITWEHSDLRAWMNGDFYEAAFTPVQRGLIETVHNENADQSITGASGGAPTDDRIFALSETESVIYFSTPAARSDIGAALATEHAAESPLSVSEDGTADWWLRSPGTYGFATQFVDASGTPSLSGANVDLQYGVRPALWIGVAGTGEGTR